MPRGNRREPFPQRGDLRVLSRAEKAQRQMEIIRPHPTHTLRLATTVASRRSACPTVAGTRMATKARLTGTASPQAGVQISPALRGNRRHLPQVVLLGANHFQISRHA